MIKKGEYNFDGRQWVSQHPSREGMTNDEIIREMRSKSLRYFLATYDAVRSRFEAVEHFNEGDGWMCRECDGKLPDHIYSSNRMTDIEILT